MDERENHESARFSLDSESREKNTRRCVIFNFRPKITDLKSEIYLRFLHEVSTAFHSGESVPIGVY